MELCSPALIYLIFSLTQVVVDTIKGLYNVALVKFIMMILFSLLLNILCERGLGIISWIIVFVPFVLMSVITSILLFVFGLDPSSGTIIPPHPIESTTKPTNHHSTTSDVKPHDAPYVSNKHQKITPQSAKISEYEKSLEQKLDGWKEDVDNIRDKL